MRKVQNCAMVTMECDWEKLFIIKKAFWIRTREPMYCLRIFGGNASNGGDFDYNFTHEIK